VKAIISIEIALEYSINIAHEQINNSTRALKDPPHTCNKLAKNLAQPHAIRLHMQKNKVKHLRMKTLKKTGYQYYQ